MENMNTRPLAKSSPSSFKKTSSSQGSSNAGSKIKKWTLEEILKRPARRQVDPDSLEKTQKVYEGTYNIWYNKWTGQKHKGRFEYEERAPTRVNLVRDTGYTLADKRKQQNLSFRTYFCLMFARGCCHKGHKCEFMHRIPYPEDTEETMKDCFGRERHRDERDDMNGVGSFNRENKTIYIGNLHPYDKPDGDKVIRKHFSPFGDVERINVIYDKNIAFVRYVKRANAEFAKEAMEHQTLDAGEIINVRWANDDPNPRIQALEKRRLEQEFTDAYVHKKAKHDSLAYLDAEAQQLVASHPMYREYYQYYAAEPAADPTMGDATETTTDDGTSDAVRQAYAAQYYAQYGPESTAPAPPAPSAPAPGVVDYSSDDD